MPVSRRTAEGLTTEVTAAYARAEVRLLRMVGQHLAAGTDVPGWAEVKLAELQLFRKRAEQLMDQVTTEAVQSATTAVQVAYRRGTATGEAELSGLGVASAAHPRQAEFAVEALVRAQANALEKLGPQVVRSVADAYRDAVVQAAAGTLTGASTRRQDAQTALDALARAGISGFTDKAGRRWGLQSYVDMATRSTTAQAAVQGHMDRLEDGGLPLFIVSNSSRECPTCRPWEGKVLSRGPVGAMVRNVLTGQMEAVHIDGTVADATAAGLFHPNCTHNLSGYVHGATKRGGDLADAKGYAEKATQRAMERNVRAWQRRAAVAITPEAKRLAEAKVRTWQAAIRDHTKATGLPRKLDRERFDLKPHVPKAETAVDVLAPAIEAGDLVVMGKAASSAAWEVVRVYPDGRMSIRSLGGARNYSTKAPAKIIGPDAVRRHARKHGDEWTWSNVPKVEAAVDAPAAPAPPRVGNLSAEQYDAMRPDAKWSQEKRDAILTALRANPAGKVLADTLDKFQDGGSIARLRKNITKRLAGEAIDPTSTERVDTLLDAIRHAPTDWAPETLYRGMTVKGKLENVLAKYAPGDSLDLSLTSFTSDRAAAVRFQNMTSKGGGGETRIMVQLVGDDKHALPIQNLPHDRRLFKEKEWVTAGRFRIVDAKKAPGGGIIVRVTQEATL